MVPFLVTLTDL